MAGFGWLGSKCGPRERLRSSSSRQELVKAVGVESFNHFGAGCGEDHHSWGSATVVGFEQFSAGSGVEAHIPLFESDSLRFQENLHHFAVKAAGLCEKQNRKSHGGETILRVYVLDLTGNFRGFFEHGGNGTILFFREADCILDRLARYSSTDTVNQLDFRVNRGRVSGTLGLGTDFHAGERLPFLLQNRNHVIPGAATQADENEFHWTVTGNLISVDGDCVAAVGDAVEFLFPDPGGAGVGHESVPLILSSSSIIGAGLGMN